MNAAMHRTTSLTNRKVMYGSMLKFYTKEN